MDPRVESAIRRACDQLGINGENFLAVVRESFGEPRLHPAVKVRKAKAEPKAGQDGG